MENLPRDVRSGLAGLDEPLRRSLEKGLEGEDDPAQLLRTALSLAQRRDRAVCATAFSFLAELPGGTLRRWWLRAVFDLPGQAAGLKTALAGLVLGGDEGAALEFCRKASRIVRRAGEWAPALLGLVACSAQADPAGALDLFLSATETLAGLPPREKRMILDRAACLGPRADHAHSFLKSSPKVLGQAGCRGLAGWLAAALKAPAPSREAFLSLSCPDSLETLDRLAGGLSLEAAARILELYARSVQDGPVRLASLAEAPDQAYPSVLAAGAVLKEDQGLKVYLPAREKSAAPLETFRARLALALAAQRYDWGFLLTFPDPWLAADLWTLAAEIRAREELLRQWPGLAKPLALLDRYRRRGLDSLPQALNPVLKAAARRVWGGRIRTGKVSGLEEEDVILAKRIRSLLGSAPDPAEGVRRTYYLLTAPLAKPGLEPVLQASPGKFASLDGRRPFEAAPGLKSGLLDRNMTLSRQDERSGFLANLSQLAEKLRRLEEGVTGRGEEKSFLYPEWDPDLGGYRADWVRVKERRAGPSRGGEDQGPPLTHPALVRSLCRNFQRLRPLGLKRLKAQSDGFELDLEAAVSRMVDFRRGKARGEGKVYLDRRLKKRDVACALLADLSGSTARTLDHTGRTVLEVAGEGLRIMAEALAALGDPFALFGFSGSGRTEVTFSVIKDFEEGWNGEVKAALAGLRPGRQNRDGAALRHAAFRLASHPARRRILFFISDGRPDDYGYTGNRALEDTRAALRETALLGIRSFGLTIDQEAREYVARMMGSTPNIILDRVERLPLLLPRLYWRMAR